MKHPILLAVTLSVGMALCLKLSAQPATQGTQTASGIPVRFTLDKPGYVTLVVEDQAGNRVANLCGETYFEAGSHTLVWDGYDVGKSDGDWGLARRRAAAGAYRVRGLTHGGIRLVYEFAVNSPGTPPWPTRDGSGAWAADHTPLSGAVFLPANSGSPYGGGRAQLLLSAGAGEAGPAFLWVDAATGRKLYGINTGFDGAQSLAYDAGANRIPGFYAYALSMGDRDGREMRLRAFKTDGTVETLYEAKLGQDNPFGPTRANAVAVRNGLIVASDTKADRLLVFDARTRKLVAAPTVKSPRGLSFDGVGRLLVVSGASVRRVLLGRDGVLSGSRDIITVGLEDPRDLYLSPSGDRLFVSDRGRSHQVKVFSSAGKLLRLIGEPGGPQLGRYNDRRMSNPSQTTLDSNGRLWVTEFEGAPKRVGVWDVATGRLTRAYYGPPHYGGGGSLDSLDKTRFFYADGPYGIEFALDWAAGSAKPRSIYWRRDWPGFEGMPPVTPERAVHIGKHTYLVNGWNGGLRGNDDRGAGVWRLDADGIARPVAILSTVEDLKHNVWGWKMRNQAALDTLWKGKETTKTLWAWSDRSGDNVAQPDEIQVAPMPGPTGVVGPGMDWGAGPLLQPDLSATTVWGAVIPAPRFDARGTPLYDVTRLSRVGDTTQYRFPAVSGGRLVRMVDGPEGAEFLAGSERDGGRRWSLPAADEAVAPQAGRLLAITRFLGPPVVPRSGQAGSLLALNGEMGAMFLVTADGLFVQTLGGDARTTPLLRTPGARRGQVLGDVSFAQEHFHPTINQTADGKIYVVAGLEHSGIYRLNGLETVRRLDFGTVSVTPDLLSSLPAERREPRRKQERQTLNVALRDPADAPVVNGDLTDWSSDAASWANLDEKASASVTVAGGTLYAAWRTGDPKALDNAGGDIHYLFKRGGALDLMVGTRVEGNYENNRRLPQAGDTRLLITQAAGKVRAVLYQQVTAGSRAPFEYASPVGKVTFDRVEDVSDRVNVAQKGGDFEVSVPLSLLGLSEPEPGTRLLGDVGVLGGNAGQTTRRLYWNNRGTQIVSDLPSEARLQPANWGVWQFVAPGSAAGRQKASEPRALPQP